MSFSKIQQQLVGSKSKDLLSHVCKTLPKEKLHLSRVDWIARIFGILDRNIQVLKSLQALYGNGWLLLILLSSSVCSNPSTHYHDVHFMRGSFEGSIGLNMGYRRDDLCAFFLFPQQSGKENFQWTGNDIFQVGGEFYLAYKNIYIRTIGDWGKICGGKKSSTKTQQVIPHFPPGTDFTAFTASQTTDTPGGHVYDISGGLGYQFYLAGDHFMLAPIIGYSFHEQLIKENKLTGETIIETNIPSTLIENDSEKRSVKFQWYGPSVGIDLAYNINCAWKCFGNYAFSWGNGYLRGTATLAQAQTFPLTDPPPTATAQVFRKVPKRTALGHDINIGFAYRFCHFNWNNPTIGLTGGYQLWTVRKNGKVDKTDKLTSHGSLTTIQGAGRLRKMQWQMWNISFDVGFTF